jgi:hypothetical protein
VSLDARIIHIESWLQKLGGGGLDLSAINNAKSGPGTGVGGGGGIGGGGSGGDGGGSLLSGDVTGPVVSNTVVKLQGTPLALTAPVTGQLIAFNGTSFINTSTITGPLTVTGLLTAGELTTGAFFDAKATGEIDANGSAGTAGQVLTSNGPGASASWTTGGSDTDSLATLTDVSLSGTAQGDVLYRGASLWNNLPAGTAGFVLTTGGPGANPSWTAASSGTLAGLGDVSLSGVAQGDLLYRGVTTWNNLPHGTSGQFLQTQGASANPIWATLPADTDTFAALTDVVLTSPAQGDVYYRNAAGNVVNLGPGTSGQVLTTQGAGANPIWSTSTDSDSLATLTDVILSGTAQGDILYRGATQWNNLPHGTAGQVLTTQGAAANPSWTTVSGGSGNVTSATAYGSEPGSPTTGDLDFYTNGIAVARWSGSAWLPWGRLTELTTPPASASLTQVNVTTATMVDNAGTRFLAAPSVGASHAELWMKTLAAGAYTWKVHLESWLFSSTFTACGLALRDSVGGKIITFEHNIFSGALNLNVVTWSDANTRVANSNANVILGNKYTWLKIHDDGTTNRTYSASYDGINWYDLFTESRTAFLGVAPNQAGVFACANGAAVALGIYSWNGV